MTVRQNANGQTLLQLNLGSSNLYVGESAGLASNSGGFNSFFGQSAGAATNSGHSNAFLGIRQARSMKGGIPTSFWEEGLDSTIWMAIIMYLQGGEPA